MSKSSPRVYSKTGLLWIGVITSLLFASSMFTLFRVRSAVSELTKSKSDGEVTQVIEKFEIIEDLLGEWLDRSLSELKRSTLVYGKPNLQKTRYQYISGGALERSVPTLSFGSVKANVFSSNLSQLA